MMRFGVLFGVAAACSGGKDADDADTDDAAPVDGDADTDADSDTDSDADTDTDTDSDTDTDTGDPCLTTVDAEFPADLAADVFYRTNVRYTLSDEDLTATITVTESGGAVVSGTTTVDGTEVTWTGDPLTPLTGYDAVLTYVCGTDTNSWTTTETGAPTTSSPEGLVYSLDLANAQWVQPPGMAGLLVAGIVGNMVVSPIAVGPSDITFRAGFGDAAGQNLCLPTVDFPSGLWADPYFELSAPLLTLDLLGVEFDINDPEMSGAFSADVTRLDGVVLDGDLDTRNLGTVFGGGAGPDAACIVLGFLGVTCDPCATDLMPYCVPVRAEDIDAPELVGGVLVPRSDADILADPACAAP